MAPRDWAKPSTPTRSEEPQLPDDTSPQRRYTVATLGSSICLRRGVIEEAKKRHNRKSEQALPLEITSKSAGPSSSQTQTKQLKGSPQEKKPSPFPALKAAAQPKAFFRRRLSGRM
ncbi:hypothetical protein GCK32_017228 [Trichostrongylus colubriformis]|uniref:Uncharacterized protein n=1 Tax=Trichostrongylus colubriformis TaxID=6319 RepID=A0AAN8IW55_TRICO